MTANRIRAAALALLFSSGMIFSQGLTWESTTASPMAGGKEIHMTSYYLPRMFKQSTDMNATIFRLDKGLILKIDKEKKEYTEMTFDELQAEVKQASSMFDSRMAEMKKNLEKMPPDQRKLVEQMMGDKLKDTSADRKVTVVKTAETKTISGYPCTKYIMKENDKDFATFWTTTDLKEFTAMKGDFRDFSERLMSMIPSKGSKIAQVMDQIEGFPVQTSIGGITTTVTKFEKGTISPADFEPPAGYTKVKSESLEEQMKKHGMQQKQTEEKPPQHE